MFPASPFLHLLSYQGTGYVYGFDYVAVFLIISQQKFGVLVEQIN
jgi:hypothetical protein